LVLRGGDTNENVSISSSSNNSAVREMSSGNKEEAKVMEAVTKVKKSNAFDVIVAAVTEERFHCHMIDVLAIGLSVRDDDGGAVGYQVVQTENSELDLFCR